MTYRAYSDGACKGNPGPGGWGSVTDTPNGDRIERRGGESETTNNKMELMGAITALQQTPVGSTVILTVDSQYVIKGVTEWMTGWKKRQWQASTGGPVKNQELWKILDAEVAQRTVKFEWVRGHTGHPENERCDELANQAIEELPGSAELIAAAKVAKNPSSKKTSGSSPGHKPATGTSGMLKRAASPAPDTATNKLTPDAPVIGDADMSFEL